MYYNLTDFLIAQTSLHDITNMLVQASFSGDTSFIMTDSLFREIIDVKIDGQFLETTIIMAFFDVIMGTADFYNKISEDTIVDYFSYFNDNTSRGDYYEKLSEPSIQSLINVIDWVKAQNYIRFSEEFFLMNSTVIPFPFINKDINVWADPWTASDDLRAWVVLNGFDV